jgi:hypothetical protein
MADLSISVNDSTSLVESCTFAFDTFVSVNDSSSLTESCDALLYTEIDVSESVSLVESAVPSIITVAKMEGYIPPFDLEAAGAFNWKLGSEAKFPVPTLAAHGVNILEDGMFPTMSMAATVTCPYYATASGKFPTPELSAVGVNVAEGTFPTLSMEATAYCSTVVASGYFPYPELEAEASGNYYAEVEGYFPVPKLSAVAYEEQDFITASGYFPPFTGRASVSQDTGVEINTLYFPIPTLAATAYKEDVYVTGYFPVPSLSAYVSAVIDDEYTGGEFSGADTEQLDGVYILRYER